MQIGALLVSCILHQHPCNRIQSPHAMNFNQYPAAAMTGWTINEFQRKSHH